MNIEKAMEFILDAQAKHAAALQEHDAWRKEHEAWWERHEAAVQRHEDWLQRHETAMRELDTKIATVTDLVGRIARAEIGHVARTKALEANMNKLFKRMDRFIEGRRGNGRRPS